VHDSFVSSKEFSKSSYDGGEMDKSLSIVKKFSSSEVEIKIPTAVGLEREPSYLLSSLSPSG